MGNAQTGGNKKRPRGARTSSGIRKNRAIKAGNFTGSRNQPGRKSPVVADFPGLLYLRHQKAHRWPSAWSENKYAELNMDRTKRRRSPEKIKPMQQGFTLLDIVIDKGKVLETLLLAASLKLKKVKRYPGYVLIRTYNLKNRPIEII